MARLPSVFLGKKESTRRRRGAEEAVFARKAIFHLTKDQTSKTCFGWRYAHILGRPPPRLCVSA